jgi:RNA polymerase sigma-70 factor (ECF subfamily)
LTEDDFASFFHERFGKTVIMLITMGASRADAEDATQEAMLAAWRQRDTIENAVAWLRTVASRKYWELVGSRPQTVSLDDSVPQAVAESGLSIFTEEQLQVLHLLRKLPSEQRTVVALRFDGATCEEIAAVTGKSPATVRSNLRHARNALKELMQTGGI